MILIPYRSFSGALRCGLGMALALLTVVGVVSAQRAPSPFGRRFIVGFPHTVAPQAQNLSVPLAVDARLIIFSSSNAIVSIRSNGYSRNVQVAPGAATIVSLVDPVARAPKIFFDRVGMPRKDVFDITSDRDISLYCYFVSPSGSEAYAPLPVEQWGTEYRSMHIMNTPVINVQSVGDEQLDLRGEAAPAQILVIAAEDGTEVTIDAATGAQARLEGARTRRVTLNAGEGYLVESVADRLTSTDLSGVTIRANKPVGLLSGNSRVESEIDLPTLSSNTQKNCGLEWVLPIDAGGRTFAYRGLFPASLQGQDIDLAEIIRVYATAPGVTRVTVAGGGTSSIPHGSFISISRAFLQSPFAVTTDKPAQAALFSASYAQQEFLWDDDQRVYEGYVTWAPAMARLLPQEQWIVQGRFHSPGVPVTMSHAASIIAEQNTRVFVDGREVTLAGAVTGGNFRQAWISLNAGDHTVSSTGGRFSAIAFGYLKGYERYKPAAARKEGPSPLHASEYDETMGASYAYPVMGIQENIESPSEINLCSGSSNGITLSNTGSDALNLTAITVVDSTGAFMLDPIKLPATIPAGGSVEIPVTFDQTRGDATRAVVRYTIRSADGRRTPVEMELAVKAGVTSVVPASFEYSFPAAPGDTVTLPLMLEDSLDDAVVTRMTISLRYDTVSIRLVTLPAMLAAMIKSTLLRDWTITVIRNLPGDFSVVFDAPAGASLTGVGKLLEPRFATMLRLIDTTSLTWRDTTSVMATILIRSRECVEVKAPPGLVRLELCGLRHRLFEMGSGTYALDGAHPNPFNPSTEIAFSLGLDGPTRLEIFDIEGRRVATLVDEHLAAGSYAVVWNAVARPSGLYYYRLTSGDWSRTGSLMLVK